MDTKVTLTNYDFTIDEGYLTRSMYHKVLGAFGNDEHVNPIVRNTIQLLDNFTDVLEVAGFMTETTDEGDLFIYRFNGNTNVRKLEQMFALLAFIVDRGSFLEFMAHDGTAWRWEFNNGVMTTYEGKLTWKRAK